MAKRPHRVKVSQEEYEAYLAEDRSSLIRPDRNYRLRDILELVEYYPGWEKPTGRVMHRIITNIDPVIYRPPGSGDSSRRTGDDVQVAVVIDSRMIGDLMDAIKIRKEVAVAA